MNNCEIFVKKQNVKMPEADLITACYKKYGMKYMTLFVSNGKKLYVDKECDNISMFIEDLYADVKSEDCFVIVFYDENNYYNDVVKDKYFYKTKNTIGISRKECDCIEQVLNLDKNKFKPFFQMFLHDNFYLEINYNGVNLNGDYTEKDDYIFSTTIEVEKEKNNKTISFNDVLTKTFKSLTDKCYICNQKVASIGYEINHVTFVCESCYQSLSCKRCSECGCHFSPRYFTNTDRCMECVMKTKMNIHDLFYEQSVGLKYLEVFINPYSDLDLYNVKTSEENVKKILSEKLFAELTDLRNKTDEFVAQMNNSMYFSERAKLFMKLKKPILIA